MTNVETIKLQLVQNIINLPEEKLGLAYELISRLISETDQENGKGLKSKAVSASPQLRPEDNPMLKFIGLADCSPLPQSIDEELYGEASS